MPIKSVPATWLYNIGNPDVVAILQKTLHNYEVNKANEIVGVC